MGVFQHILDKELEQLPRAMLTQLISEKLQEAGYPDAALAENIAKRMMDGEDKFERPDGSSIALEFDDNDCKRVEVLAERFTDNIPDLVRECANTTGSSLADALRVEWQEYYSKVDDEYTAFKGRLRNRWGDALDGLGILLEIALDLGNQFDERIAKSKIKQGALRDNALSQLHMRACQTTAEIICLLGNGFADAAMSRWRTLYEVSIVAILIADGGDELADRYLAHEIVERKKAADEFQRCALILGEKRISHAEYEAIQKEFSSALLKYGRSFRETYGWAAGFCCNNQNPKFWDLQQAAGRAGMHIYYKLSSNGVHAGPSGITAQLGALYDMQLSGASNAGLEMPGSKAAHCIVSMMSLLWPKPLEFDGVVIMTAAINLRDEACQAFENAATKLERDEERERQRIVRRFSARQKRRPMRHR